MNFNHYFTNDELEKLYQEWTAALPKPGPPHHYR